MKDLDFVSQVKVSMNFATPSFTGIKVIGDEACTQVKWKQIKFPKSKRKRIRKKWSKRKNNFGPVKEYSSYLMGDTLFLSPEQSEKFSNLLTEK